MEQKINMRCNACGNDEVKVTSIEHVITHFDTWWKCLMCKM